MEALVFEAKSLTLKLERRPVPQVVRDEDVLIKVAYSGICGTDLHIVQGHFPVKSDGPVVLGHEFSGVVGAVGKGVVGVKIGDKVTVNPNRGCYNCTDCHQGQPHFCAVGLWGFSVGLFRDGGFAEYAVVPETHVHKLPEALTLEQGSLTEPISCLMHGWDMIAPISVGKRVLITGAGIIGNLWLISLLGQGHRNVTVSEPNRSRVKQLKQSFPQVDITTPDVLAARSKTGEEDQQNGGYDFCIDCSGNPRAIEQGLSLLRRGGKMCIFGVASPESRISVSPYHLFDRELTIVAVKINPYTFPKALGLMESLSDRYLNYDLLGIKVFKLSEYEKAMDELREGTIAKAMFRLH